jgi:hypothetical protein
MSGKRVWQQQAANLSVIPSPVENVPAGVYVVTVSNAVGTKTVKWIKE